MLALRAPNGSASAGKHGDDLAKLRLKPVRRFRSRLRYLCLEDQVGHDRQLRRFEAGSSERSGVSPSAVAATENE